MYISEHQPEHTIVRGLIRYSCFQKHCAPRVIEVRDHLSFSCWSADIGKVAA